ncbi:hypothetical protein SPRG_02792 [Saprolegnia parasitica CBS 223.65]|uniref:Uncharacterized protein n=1 Tax=Saprolegnia parasitica (strain CBS 223.65) TaxID=695850 RepID=A0A067CP97_SAPPC|nr:hypothetical protein SPRG_02792 [Saprolegnia parasitica CBS 223.65]KDO32313.1 hypothetical protein SPRG_02792 [Saprolegnia parasitica CBS 223.65]|eukprot:XP_012196769.1 hypothetical protein SPRG_02792 [Saprolegnia parasitica CBS 223.65]
MASFIDVVLHQAEIAAMVFEFQLGVYEDVLSRFMDFRFLVDFTPCGAWYNGYYALDPALRTSLRGFSDAAAREKLRATDLYLNELNYRDERFPLHLAIAEGDIVAAKRMLACRPDLAYQDAIAVAVEFDQLEMAALLLELRATITNLLVPFDATFLGEPPRSLDSWLPLQVLEKDNAAILPRCRKGRGADSHFLYERMPDAIYAGFMNDAAKMGLLAIVQDLHSRGEACTTDAMDQAAANGHLEVVRFLQEHRTEGCSTDAMTLAVANGHVDVVRFFIERRGLSVPCDALDVAAVNGHLELVTYLHGLGMTAPLAIDFAAANGHLDVVRFLLDHHSENGTTRDTLVHKLLQCGGNDIVLDLVAQGYPLPTGDVALTECLKKPHALAVLQLLLDHNVLFTPKMMAAICTEANDDVFQLVETKVPASPWTCEMVQSALRNKHIHRAINAVAQQPELRDFSLAELIGRSSIDVHPRDFIPTTGVDAPRTLVCNWWYTSDLKVFEMLLPYCMQDDDPIDNLAFLVHLYVKRSTSLTQSWLLLLKGEMVRQATAANCLLSNTEAGVDVEVLAAALLARGAVTTRLVPRGRMLERTLDKSAVADWGLTVLFVHFWSTDVIKHALQLVQWIDQVQDDEMKSHLQRLLKDKLARLECPHILTAAEKQADDAQFDMLWPTSADY